MKRFEYSILRAVPNRRRGEIVNIGIAVFLNGRTDIRVLPSLNKLKAIDPNINVEPIYQLGNNLGQLLPHDTPPESRREILNGFGDIWASEIAWFSCLAKEYDSQVDAILRALVVPPARERKPGNAPTRLETTMRHNFSLHKVLGTSQDDIASHRVIPHYLIASEENLYADFMLKNGAWHVTETIDFRGTQKTVHNDKFKVSALKAITLYKATKVFKKCVPLVVYYADQEKLDEVQPHINLLSDHAERLYNYADPKDMASYMDYILKAAGMSPVTQLS